MFLSAVHDRLLPTGLAQLHTHPDAAPYRRPQLPDSHRYLTPHNRYRRMIHRSRQHNRT
jgi:hypothetical protein